MYILRFLYVYLCAPVEIILNAANVASLGRQTIWLDYDWMLTTPLEQGKYDRIEEMFSQMLETQKTLKGHKCSHRMKIHGG